MALIDTKAGPRDESDLFRVTGTENGPVEVFGWIEWRDPETGAVLRKDRTVGFKKNPGHGMIETTRGPIAEAALDCRLTLVDNETEFTVRQEFRDPVTGEEIQSSVNVNLKNGLECAATAAALPGMSAEQSTAS